MINSKLKQSISKNSSKLWQVCLLALGMVIVAFIIFIKMPIAFYKAGDATYTKNALEHYQVLILEVNKGQHRLIADNDGLNEAKALIDNLTVLPTPIGYDRDSSQGHQMIFIDAENNVKKLCFSLDYKEVWYDNGVKPGRHYVTNEPIVLKRYFEQQLSKNVPNSLHPMFSAESLKLAKVRYLGDASSVGNMLMKMPLHPVFQHDYFELKSNANKQPLGVIWHLKSDVIDKETITPYTSHLQQVALVLLGLIENVEQITLDIVLANDEQLILRYDQEWANGYILRDETLENRIECAMTNFPIIESRIMRVDAESDKQALQTVIPSMPSVQQNVLGHAIFMDSVVKSYAFEGETLASLKSYYILRRIDVQKASYTEYIVYKNNAGKAVIQNANNRQATYIDSSFIERLDAAYNK